MQRELEAVKKCDYVVTLNEKDRELLLKSGVSCDKVGTIVPYFEKPKKINRTPNGKDIIFYGAMGRMENSISVKWFVEKVMPLIDDLDVRFLIIGSNPTSDVKELQSSKVVVTGFVDDIVPYFEKAICMVAPLQLGAG